MDLLLLLKFMIAIELVILVAVGCLYFWLKRTGRLDRSQRGEAQSQSYWVIELTPAFEGHPPFPATYYAGGREALGSSEQATVLDLRAAPRWKHKEAADRIVETLLPTKSCVWRAVEYIDTVYGPLKANKSAARG